MTTSIASWAKPLNGGAARLAAPRFERLTCGLVLQRKREEQQASESCLDKLAPLAKIPDTLWEWINERDGFWLRPRTDEQFDVLLKSLTGKTLKDQSNLWELFKNLRSPRHSYIHTGRTVIGKDELNVERETTLVNGATQIIDWVDDLLPEQLRRPRLGLQFSVAFKTAIPIARVATAETPSSLAPPAGEGKAPET